VLIRSKLLSAIIEFSHCTLTILLKG